MGSRLTFPLFKPWLHIGPSLFFFIFIFKFFSKEEEEEEEEEELEETQVVLQQFVTCGLLPVLAMPGPVL